MRVERTFGADMYEQNAQGAAWANMDVPNVLSIPWAVTRPFHFPSAYHRTDVATLAFTLSKAWNIEVAFSSATVMSASAPM